MIHIRRARQPDLKDIIRLHKESLDTISSKIGENYLNMLYSLILNDQKNHLVLLAEDKNDLLGVISITKSIAKTKEIFFSREILLEVIKSIALLKVNLAEFLKHLIETQMIQNKIPNGSVYIMTLFVKGDFQGKGIGSKLVEKSLKSQEGSQVFVDTLSSNKIAQKFYGSLGFRKVAQILDSELLVLRKVH